MSVKDKLQIVLITYNRKKYLQRTLDEILAESSPIKDYDITILDNASTDGTTELIDEYSKKFPHITHIRHMINIGGDANICRAFEIGASSGKEYVWVLCDDDKYDFSNWGEVEKQIKEKTDIICLCDYAIPDNESKNNPVYHILQLSFVPAGIYRAELINDSVLLNMYTAIYTLFQQTCITISAINHNKKIHVLSKPVVFNGLHFEDACTDLAFTRGGSKKEILKRRRDSYWVLGFSNILSLLDDQSLVERCLEAAIPYKDIYGSWENFYNCVYDQFIKCGNFNYFWEVYTLLPQKHKDKIAQLQNANIEFALKEAGFSISLSQKATKLSNKKFIQKIFSIVNSSDRKHKIITFLGMKLAIKR